LTGQSLAKVPRRGLAAIPRGVWALGVVSLCMDLSSELIHSLLPLYMSIGLGASTLTIGVVEGVAEGLALIVKVFSGVWSDVVRKRKALVVIGYGMAALTKFIFPLAPTLGWVVTARFADRIGKGIRGAPRDALIADITPSDVRGASFGLRQALDTVGGIGGPLLALVAMFYFADNFRATFWVAVVPAVVCVGVLVFAVQEPAKVGGDGDQQPLRLSDAKRFPAR
jgi:sugar phosphate permease